MKTAKELLGEYPELLLIVIDSILEQARERIVLALSDPLRIVVESDYATEELLLEALKHPNNGVRYSVVTNNKVSITALTEALKDLNQLVRDTAERQLKKEKNNV